MKLTMLGTGNAIATACYNTCFVIEDKDRNGRRRFLLVDGGGGNQVLGRLKKARIDWKEIRDMIVTHRHMDHILGILWMVRMICSGLSRGAYHGDARIYGSRETLRALWDIAGQLLSEKELRYIDTSQKDVCAAVEQRQQAKTACPDIFPTGKLRLIIVLDGEERSICGHSVRFFDTGSKRAEQMGFSMELETPGDILTCCGDEAVREKNRKYAEGSKWLMHEAFCLDSQADIFRPYEKGHSTVKDACETAERLGIDNLILFHSEDMTIQMRKGLYRAEGGRYFSGNLFVPSDMETIEL